MEDYLSVQEDLLNYNYLFNASCNENEIPSAGQYITSLGMFGTMFISIGAILTAATLGLAMEASYRVLLQPETKYYKTNCMVVLSVYPIASTCSLIALSIPSHGVSPPWGPAVASVNNVKYILTRDPSISEPPLAQAA